MSYQPVCRLLPCRAALSVGVFQDVIDRYEKICEEALEASKKETQIYNKHWIDSPWSGFFEVS